MFPKDLKYTENHEWAKVDDNDANLVIVGITDHAQNELGDIVFVELPAVGREIEQLKEFGVVESVKTVSPIYSPVSGIVSEINEVLESTPGLINDDPYGDGWLVKIKISDANELDELMSAEEYEESLREDEEEVAKEN